MSNRVIHAVSHGQFCGRCSVNRLAEEATRAGTETRVRRRVPVVAFVSFGSPVRVPADGEPVYVILDNLSANKTPKIRSWATESNVELCFTPTNASWANPIEAQFGPLRTFVMGDSNHPNHTVLARRLQDYLRWRNVNARHPDVLAAQRQERARVRSERQQRWGRPRAGTAAA